MDEKSRITKDIVENYWWEKYLFPAVGIGGIVLLLLVAGCSTVHDGGGLIPNKAACTTDCGHVTINGERIPVDKLKDHKF